MFSKVAKSINQLIGGIISIRRTIISLPSLILANNSLFHFQDSLFSLILTNKSNFPFPILNVVFFFLGDGILICIPAVKP